MTKISIFTCVMAILLGAFIRPALADEHCKLSIDANDAMQFSAKSMSAPASCATVTVTLNHTGQFPKNAMGHNWVLTTGADFN